MEFTNIGSKSITDSDYKVNASQGNARLMLNTKANLALKSLPGFANVSSEVKTSILSPSGTITAEGTLIINAKSSRLSLNQAKVLFGEAQVKVGDVFTMHACVHIGQLHMKLIKADATTTAPAAPKRPNRRPSGIENMPTNTGVTTSAPAFIFGAQDAALAAGTAAVRAKKTAPRQRKVLRNKRVSNSATTSEQEPMDVTVAAFNADAEVGRVKRKNAGKNRRYSDEEYVVEEAEEEKSSKRRRTGVSSAEPEAAAQAPHGLLKDYLLQAMEVFNELNSIELNTVGALLELGNGLVSAMELD